MGKKLAIKIKRVYETPDPKDGVRILVDRFWPRGISKDKANINEWQKDISPAKELIKWFGHKPERWEEFRKRYKEQLADKQDLIKRLKDISKTQTLTLIYSAKDESHNNAVVLKEVLEGKN